MKFKNYLIIAVIIFVFGFVGLVVVQACTVNVTPTPTLTLCDTEAAENVECTTPTVTQEPTASESATPTVEPTRAVVFTGNGDGKSDNRSDGLSSCPSCTQAPVIPLAAPATGKGL